MFVVVYLVLVFGLGFTEIKGNPVPPAGNLIEVANQIGFTTFTELLTEANLNHLLEGEDKYIVFAPTDQAFEEIGEAELSLLKSDPEFLEKTLQSHISPQEVQPEGISDGAILKTLALDEELKISLTENGALVNGKEFNENGIEATNGILYPTSKILYSSLNNDSQKEESSGSESLMQVLNNNGCKTLAELITKANLTELECSGKHTIFAPKDEAFASLSPDEHRVLKSNDILLKNLIKSHVTEGELFSYNLEDGGAIESWSSGYFLKFLVKDDGSITVNDVPIIKKDLKASNGVVNVINNVLISSSKGLKSENLPPVLKVNEYSFINFEQEVGSFVEVTGLTVKESSNNTLIYTAVNENADFVPSTVDEKLEKNMGTNSSAGSSQNGKDHNTTGNENDAEITMSTLELNKTKSGQTNYTKTKVSEGNANEGNLGNEIESTTSLSTQSLTSGLHGDSVLEAEASIQNHEEDLITTAAAETESSSQSKTTMDEGAPDSTPAMNV